jgi:hypothetical protein
MNGPEQLPLEAAAVTPEPPASIIDLLSRKHPSGEWAFMREIAPRPIGGRFADAIAVNLWASRGYVVHGFEVKVSRSDWLRELKQPEKAEPIFRYCDRWFLVAERDVVKPGELPATWGHLERRGGALHVVVAAPKLEPVPLTREFFASMMRRGHEQIEAFAEVRYRDRFAEAEREHQKRVSDGIRRSTREHEDLRVRVAKFVEVTGLAFDEYHAFPPASTIALARRIQALSDWNGEKALHKLAELAGSLERAAVQVRQAISETGLTSTTEA